MIPLYTEHVGINYFLFQISLIIKSITLYESPSTHARARARAHTHTHTHTVILFVSFYFSDFFKIALKFEYYVNAIYIYSTILRSQKQSVFLTIEKK